MTPWSTIEVTVEDRLAYVRFARPDRRNAVTTQVVTELYYALAELSANDTVLVVVLTGAGSTFCPGAEVGADREVGSAAVELPEPATYHSARLLREMPQVTVAAINGGCAGAGLAWAAACDLRFATERARFSTALLQVGLASELGLPWTLERILGAAVARDLCFLPRKFTAADALRVGLVSRVFADESFARETRTLAEELAARQPQALRTLKANFLDAARMPLAEYLDVETERHQRPFRGAAAQESFARLAAHRADSATDGATDVDAADP